MNRSCGLQSADLGHRVTLNVADRVPVTEAEGPGRRYALWVQGCPLRCPGCCNPQMLEFRPAERLTVGELLREIAATREIEGVTFVGGEPFSQAEGLAKLAAGVRAAGRSVMVFTGHTLSELQQRGDSHAAELLAHTDLLVDGPYLREQAVFDRRWIGSANQRVHFLSERYRHLADDREGWDKGRNTIELRLINGQLQVNGFPHRPIVAPRRGNSQTGEV